MSRIEYLEQEIRPRLLTPGHLVSNVYDIATQRYKKAAKIIMIASGNFSILTY